MLAFRIELNDREFLVAGFEDWDTLNATLLAIRENIDGALEFQFHLGGGVRTLEAGKLEHVRWNAPELKVGDKLSISIVDVDAADAPVHRYRSDRIVQENPFTPEQIERLDRQEYERLRKKFERVG